MRERECQKCGGLFPLSEFPFEPRIESGRLWKCRECAEKDELRWRVKTQGKWRRR